MAETPIRRPRRAPMLGEHNAEIYEALLGLSSGDVDSLRASGVI